MSNSIIFDSNGRPASDRPNFQFQDQIPTKNGVIEGRVPGQLNTVKVSNGVTRFQSGAPAGQAIEHISPERARAEDFKRPDSGIVGSAKSTLSNPKAARDLRPDDLVDLGNGMKTTVAAAVRIGAIRKTADGYEDVNAQPAHSQQPQRPQNPEPTLAPEDTASPVPEEYVGAVNILNRGVAPAVQAAAIEQLSTTGQVSPALLKSIGDQLGVEPAVVSMTIDRAVQGLNAAL